MSSFHGPDMPFNELPLLPPSCSIESKAILKRCIAAAASLSELKVSGGLIPDQSVLINTIPVLEAKVSSEIENIFTTTDRLFEHLESHIESNSIDPATKEALQYREALFQGYQSLKHRPVTTHTAIEVCSTLKSQPMTIRASPGTRIVDSKGKTIYTPPEGTHILNKKLSNWERFLHENEEIETLVRFAIGHYQFEAIHPFSDGNGRTGRVLNILYLVDKGLLELPVLYLSKYIIEKKTDYYRLLLEVTEKQNWEEWIIYMLDAVKETADWTVKKIEDIRELMSNVTKTTRDQLPRIYTRELIEIIFSRPYARIQNLVEAKIARRQTAAEYLRQLESIGILKSKKIGRELVFINHQMMQVLSSD